MFKWTLAVVVIISTAILGYMYYQLEQISGTPEITVTPPTNAVRIIDAFSDGIHRYSGSVRLAHSCYAVDQTIGTDPKNPNTVIITLISKDKMLDQKLCAQIPTSYPFEEVYEGPPETQVKLLLDERELPVRLVKTAWQSPSGDIINTIEKPTVK